MPAGRQKEAIYKDHQLQSLDAQVSQLGEATYHTQARAGMGIGYNLSFYEGWL